MSGAPGPAITDGIDETGISGDIVRRRPFHDETSKTQRGVFTSPALKPRELSHLPCISDAPGIDVTSISPFFGTKDIYFLLSSKRG